MIEAIWSDKPKIFTLLLLIENLYQNVFDPSFPVDEHSSGKFLIP